MKSTIKYYADAAAAIYATPITSSEAELLTDIQTKMMYDIMKAYGINVDAGTEIEEILRTKVVSMLGKAWATSILKFIPCPGLNAIDPKFKAIIAYYITTPIGRGLCNAAEMIINKRWQNDSDKVIYSIRRFIR